MKIKLNELGILKQAEFELGDLTIICGKNNTGKTYATYALYGFLLFWKEAFDINIVKDYYETLLDKSSVFIDLDDYTNNRSNILKKACQKYKDQLPAVFASKEKYFENTKFEMILDKPKNYPRKEFEQTLGTSRKQIFQIMKGADSSKEPPVKTGGILEFKQSLSAVFFALHLDIFLYRSFAYTNR